MEPQSSVADVRTTLQWRSRQDGAFTKVDKTWPASSVAMASMLALQSIGHVTQQCLCLFMFQE